MPIKKRIMIRMMIVPTIVQTAATTGCPGISRRVRKYTGASAASAPRRAISRISGGIPSVREARLLGRWQPPGNSINPVSIIRNEVKLWAGDLAISRRTFLTNLSGASYPPQTAGRVDRSQRQVLAAVRALEARGLVVVRKGFLLKTRACPFTGLWRVSLARAPSEARAGSSLPLHAADIARPSRLGTGLPVNSGRRCLAGLPSRAVQQPGTSDFTPRSRRVTFNHNGA